MLEQGEGRSNGGSSCSRQWVFCGDRVPKDEIVFCAQVLAIYIVLITSVVSLLSDRGEVHIWTGLLGSCIGYLLPNPTLRPR